LNRHYFFQSDGILKRFEIFPTTTVGETFLNPSKTMVRWLRASTRAFKFLAFNDFVALIAVIISCSTNWYCCITLTLQSHANVLIRYVITPGPCHAAQISLDDTIYTAISKNPSYIKVFYGLCSEVYTTSSSQCRSWDDTSFWKQIDQLNLEVSEFTTSLESDATYNWPMTYRLLVVCLIMIAGLLLFFLWAIFWGNVKWETQIAISCVQILLVILLWIHLALGLNTETVLPATWKFYSLGCNVHTEPGSAWWVIVLAATISLFSSVLLLFPYMMGPTWVNVVTAGRDSGGVTPIDDIDMLVMNLEEGDDALDPYAGLAI
jgi:hypothetical protein